jgi:uncharacterized protein (TIGR03382 family)
VSHGAQSRLAGAMGQLRDRVLTVVVSVLVTLYQRFEGRVLRASHHDSIFVLAVLGLTIVAVRRRRRRRDF